MEITITINNNETEKEHICTIVSENATPKEERTEEKTEKKQMPSLEELIGKSYRTILYLSDASKRDQISTEEVVEILNVLGDIQRRLRKIHSQERV